MAVPIRSSATSTAALNSSSKSAAPTLLTAQSDLLSSGSSSSASRIRATPDFLAVVLDLNPLSWFDADSSVDEQQQRSSTNGSSSNKGEEKSSSGASDAGKALRHLRRALDEVCIFLNAHTATQHENATAVYGAGLGRAELLFSSSPFNASTSSLSASSQEGALPEAEQDANTFSHFRHLDDQVVRGATRMLLSQVDEGLKDKDASRAPLGLVSAIAQALCHINRLASSEAGFDGSASTGSASAGGTVGTAPPGSKSNGAAAGGGASSSFRSRMLVLSVTPDASAQYVPMMNCIFAAQKRSVVIDVCKVWGPDTVFLQQASHLTGGSYFRLTDRRALLQTLMSAYLPSRSIRPYLNLPTQDEVDFRAACFCHRRIVDVGYICSVCLSIFCSPRARCPTCKALFPRNTLRRFNAEGGQQKAGVIEDADGDEDDREGLNGTDRDGDEEMRG